MIVSSSPIDQYWYVEEDTAFSQVSLAGDTSIGSHSAVTRYPIISIEIGGLQHQQFQMLKFIFSAAAFHMSLSRVKHYTIDPDILVSQQKPHSGVYSDHRFSPQSQSL
ncbi:hypothetical protein PG994_001535 [Apiospora phragmitis]|uniref:Uncharacterized protein n=1 Tax=Apiospora phragmitis TaxID=2905665 RepID=A0ABR1WTT5_9PEZI